MFVCIGMCLQLCVCARVCVHVCVCSIEICICRLCVQAQYVYAHECIKVAIENGMHLTGMLNGPVHGNSLHTVVCSYTHTHLFNGPLSRTTQVSRYQKGKTNLDFTEARDNEWQWHQVGHMQVCISLQTDTTPAPHHSGFYRPDALPATQPIASKHWRHCSTANVSKFEYRTHRLPPALHNNSPTS